jgi:hypothetical protein
VPSVGVPNVSASVIYIKELDAHPVDARTIYVHKLKIKGRKGKHDDD